MSTGAYPGPRPDRATAQRNREAALARLTRVRGMIIVAAGAITAAVAGVVSAASGHTLGATHAVAAVAPTPSRTAAPAARMPRLASARQLGLGGPAQPPAPVATVGPPAPSAPVAASQPVPGPAVSGGS